MSKKYVYINNDVTKNRSCYLFLYQQRKLHGFFEESEIYEIINDDTQADFVVIISCVVVKKFKYKTIDLINKYAENSNTQVICYGCFSHLEEELLPYNKVTNVHFVDNDDINKFNSIFTEKKLPMFEDVIESSKAVFENNADEKNSWITVWHWCLWDCNFCNHNLTKTLKSKPVNLIKFELKKRLSEWISHFRFIWDEVASYGYDFKEKVNFIELLQQLLKVDPDFTFSLWPIYPEMLIKHEEEIFELLSSWRVTEAFIAIEHISQLVLKRMNRHYDIEKVLTIVKRIKTTYPHIKTATHIMYGFDWETRDEFKKIFRVGHYFDQVQFNELSFTEYLQKKMPDYKHEPKEIQFRKQAILKYYKDREGFLAFFDHRIIVLRTEFKATPKELDALTF